MAFSRLNRLGWHLALVLLPVGALAQPDSDPQLTQEIRTARSQLESHVPKYPAAELTRLSETLGRSNYLARAIEQAVIRDDFTNAAGFLAQFPGTPDNVYFGGETLLLNTSSRDDTNMLGLLLRFKADPNRANSSGDTALLRAIQSGHWDNALMLLDAGADALHTNAQGASPLNLLVRFNWANARSSLKLTIVQKLLDAGADPFEQFDNQSGASVAEQALRSMDAPIGDLLLTNRPGVERRTPLGDTALHLAVEWNRTNAVEFLLANGFSINQTNSSGLTPLQVVAQMAASIDAPVQTGSSPLGKSRIVFVTGPAGFFPGGFSSGMSSAWLLAHGATLDIWSAAALGKTNELVASLQANPDVVNARDGLGRTPLHYAALASRLDTAKLLIRAGADLSAATTRPVPSIQTRWSVDSPGVPSGSTPVHLACLKGDGAMLQLFLRCGAAADVPDSAGNLPLHVAAQAWRMFDQTNCAWLLLEQAVPLDATNHDGRSALRLAVEDGMDRLVKVLLAAGARRDAGLTTNSLLHIAAARGNPNTISNLLDRAHNVNERDSNGATPFLYAIKARQTASMQFLVAKGADVNAADSQGETALHFAAAQQFDMLGFPIEIPWLKRWEQNWLMRPGFRQRAITNLIHWKILSPPPPVTWTNESLTAWLIEHHANPNVADSNGRTPLHALLEQQWVVFNSSQITNRIATLLKGGAKIDLKDSNGRTAIHLAASLPSAAALSMLAPLATNLDSLTDKYGRTPLHYAVISGPQGYQLVTGTNISLLLARGANPNVRDNNGMTPLHLAVTNRLDQTPAIVGILLNHHADPNVRDALGRTPLHLLAKSMRGGAYYFRAFEAVEEMMKAGADPALLDEDGQTILHRWCTQGRVHYGDVDQMLRQFLAKHENLANMTNADGETPLHVALRSKDFMAAQTLMQYGANPSLRNAAGETGYYLASKSISDGMASTVRPKGTSYSFMNAINTRSQHEFELWLAADPALANITFDNGQTALSLATRQGIPRQFADRLLSLGAQMDIQSALRLGRMVDFRRLATNTSRLTQEILIEALRLGRFEEMEDIALASPQLRATNGEGHTLLHYTRAGQAGITSWLREHGVQETLFDAVAAGDTNFLSAVLATNRALAGLANTEGQSLLMLAARSNEPGCARILMENGAEISSTVGGCSALTFACAVGAEDVAAQLLEAGAQPDVRQQNGLTPLHLAAIGGHVKTVAVLLEHGVDPDQVQTNKTDKMITMPPGSTALHWAANWGRVDVVRLLMQHAANVHLTNEAGDSPLDMVPQDYRGSPTWYSAPPHTAFAGRPAHLSEAWQEIENVLVQAGATRKKS